MAGTEINLAVLYLISQLSIYAPPPNNLHNINFSYYQDIPSVSLEDYIRCILALKYAFLSITVLN